MGVLDGARYAPQYQIALQQLPINAQMLRRVEGQEDDLPCTLDGGEFYPRSIFAVLVLALLPAGFILLTMLVGGALDLSEDAKETLSQLAGGALLVTYISELFKGDRLINLRESRTGMPLFSKWCAAAFGFVIGVILQKSLDNGMAWTGPHGPISRVARHEATASDSGQMVYFVIGFVTDGVVIAFCTSTCRPAVGIFDWGSDGGACTAGEAILALVFSIDNAIDGLGIAPKANRLQANGSIIWGCLFFCSVFLGGIIGYGMRRFLARLKKPSPSRWAELSSHLEIWIKVATMTSILLGALELMPHGLTGAVLTGFICVWLLLFVGERIEVVQYNLVCCCKKPIPLYDPIICSE